MLSEVAKTFLFAGGLLIVVGMLLLAAGKFFPMLGGLPGDIIVKHKHSTFYFPVTTCLLISGLVTLFFYLLRNK